MVITAQPAERGFTILRMIVGAMLIATLLAGLFFWMQHVGEKLTRWERIGKDLQTELPPFSRAVLAMDRKSSVVASSMMVVLMFGIASMAACSRSIPSSALWAISLLCLVGVGFAGLEYSHRSLDSWLAAQGAVQPPLTTERINRELESMENPAVSRGEFEHSAQVIRLAGLKHAVELIQVNDPTVDRLRRLASDAARPDWTRFFAAWALMPICQRREDCCSALAAGLRAAINSSDKKLFELGRKYLDHKCLRDPEVPGELKPVPAN